MAKDPIKMKAVYMGEETKVTALLKHPMETGARKDAESGELIPAHYITEVLCKHNDALVLTINMGPSASKNPKIKFGLKGGQKGDKVTISWQDNKGESASGDTEIV